MCEGVLGFVFANFRVAGRAMDGRTNCFFKSLERRDQVRGSNKVGFPSDPHEKNRAHGCGAARDPLGINPLHGKWNGRQ